MEILCFLVVLVMATRCVSFGVATISERNIAGGIAVIALAIGSAVCGTVVFY